MLRSKNLRSKKAATTAIIAYRLFNPWHYGVFDEVMIRLRLRLVF